jgi:hypothetical protein
MVYYHKDMLLMPRPKPWKNPSSQNDYNTILCLFDKSQRRQKNVSPFFEADQFLDADPGFPITTLFRTSALQLAESPAV